MKMLFCLIAIYIATTALAQKAPLLHITPKNRYQSYQSLQSAPTLIDTTNMYSSKYGKVARLTQDNMPCILPYNTTIKIPNAAGQKQAPTDIPNAWKGRKYPAQALPQYPMPNVTPRGKYYNKPDLWKTDSLHKK